MGVIDVIGEKAAEHPDGLSLLQFVIIFCIAGKIWAVSIDVSTNAWPVLTRLHVLILTALKYADGCLQDMTMWINYFAIDDVFVSFSPYMAFPNLSTAV